MYVICTYDVEQKRCVKIMKLLRQYLFQVQNSVFEGELTPARVKELKAKIDHLITDDDSVIFYFTYKNKAVHKDTLGKTIEASNIII